MKKYLNKEYILLYYILLITGIYPVLFLPESMPGKLSPYYSVLCHYVAVFLFFGVVPMFIVKFVFHEKIRDYGWNLNNFKTGLRLILIVVPILAVVIWFSAKDPDFVKEYPLAKSINSSWRSLMIMETGYLLYYIGWEFLFRGFIIFGLMSIKKCPLIIPIAIQTLATTLIHFNKPHSEIILALVSGLVLGYYVYKYKTIWFALFIHFAAGIMMDLFILVRN